MKELPILDPLVLGFITHALNNYLHVSAPARSPCSPDALKDSPQKDVGVWLQGLQDATSRMVHLVREMRAEPQKTAPAMRFEKIDLVVLVGRACDFYRRIAARKQIEILFRNSSPPPPKVRTDRVSVAAILDNLLTNAVKFSAREKKISVEVCDEAGSVVCRVQDEGPGIRPQDRTSLFSTRPRS